MNNIEWSAFILSDIFNLTSTKSGIDKNKINFDIKNGEMYYPYITRTEKNNGLDEFILEQNYELNEGNVIRVGSDTQTVFYQPYSFYTGRNIKILSNDYLNKYNALFLVNLLKNVLNKFNWGGNGATLTRLKNCRILLPITAKGLPNYKYMEEYMKSKEKELIQQYLQYNSINLDNFERTTYNLKDNDWNKFYISELFEEIQRGKRLTKSKFINGEIPFISSTAEFNGIYSLIGNKEDVRLFENCLTLANSGSVGSTFYHPYEFVASDHVTHLKNSKFNKYIYLFLASLIKRLEQKYNFNREINDTRLKREIVILPVTEKGDINYKFIEDYMKNIEEKQVHKYLNFLKSKSMELNNF